MRQVSPSFHPVLRLFHWVMAIMVIAMIFIGVGMVSAAGPLFPRLLAIHRPLGIAILVMVLIRLPLRLSLGAPALPADLSPVQAFAARLSHVLLYAAMVCQPLIGWAMLSAGGYPVQLWPGVLLPPILPHDLHLYATLRPLHGLVARLLFALIVLHVAAALSHGLIRRDGVLRSMTIGQRSRRADTPSARA